MFPLDNQQFQRAITPRPSLTAGRTVFTYSGENSGIAIDNAPSILNKSYTITAEVDVPEGGGEGVIVTAGGRFGGFGLYLLKGNYASNRSGRDLICTPKKRSAAYSTPLSTCPVALKAVSCDRGFITVYSDC